MTWRRASPLAGVVALVAGCAPPAVDVEPPTGGDAQVCAAVVAALPHDLDGLEPRAVNPPDTGRTAAWGDPAVMLRCGVGQPATYMPDATLLSVDGVDWYPEELERGIRYTTYALSTCVEVDVPEDYLAPAELLPALAPALATIPPGQGCEPLP